MLRHLGRRGRWVAAISALLFTVILLYLGRLALIEMRIRMASVVSLHYGDVVELSGWNLGDSNFQLLRHVRITASSISNSEYGDLVLQVGERKLVIGGATADDVLALGATPSSAVNGDFDLVFGPNGNTIKALHFRFESGALDMIVGTVNESDASAGTRLISLLRSGNPGKLDLPCSKDQAIAFFGQPARTVYESRGGSVTVSDD